MKTRLSSILGALSILSVVQLAAAPAPTAFTYQGKLSDGGAPATGTYDLEFALYDAATGGASPNGSATLNDVGVTNGLFTVQLDFGKDAFSLGARWMEISVRAGDSTNAFTTLSPREVITAAPLANHSLSADLAYNALNSQSADVATTAGAVAWANVTGKPAGFADGVDNDTSYTAGAGLSLGGGNQFSVSFSGNGTNATAARSDHNHFGQTWSGASSASGFNLFNTASDGRALTGRQGAGSGYVSILGITAGLWGDSHDGSGLLGSSFDGAGVYGLANDSGYNNNPTYGGYFQNNGYGYGVFATSDRGQAAHFQITDSANNSPALVATTGGRSHAGQFVINNSANANDAVSATTSGSGDAVSGFNSGTGHAGRFQISASGNSSDAIHAQTAGSGDAINALTSGNGDAVHGVAGGTGSALYAKNTGGGAALELDGGAFKITGAGQNTTTAAFIHETRIDNSNAFRTRINHALCNNKPNAILIITPRGEANHDAPFGVLYNASENAWSITLMGDVGEPLAIGTKFNVLVITP